MNFCELDIKTEYRTFRDNIVNDFYTPVMNRAITYKRAVGFFSSSALIELSRGISGLVKNGGRIMLIASPRLQEDDVEAIKKGYEDRKIIIERVLMDSWQEPKNYFEEQRLNLLANLIAKGKLDIKIALIETSNNIGMYHEKMGLLYDVHGNIIAFTGSMNESYIAFSQNYETIDVFCSWKEEINRIEAKERAFNNMWDNSEPNIVVMDFPEVAHYKLQTYRKNEIVYDLDASEENVSNSPIPVTAEPMIPADVRLHDYQLEAISKWEELGYSGIFDMATGTGKTYTGLAAITKLYHHCNDTLAVIIVCPFQHLVEQWVEDIVYFNMKPIIAYSASKQKDWKTRFKNAVVDFNLGIKNHFCLVTTNATFSSTFVREKIVSLKGNVVLIVDEAHNFGATNLSSTLNPSIPYRLALSATIERHGDEEGTAKIFEYFGERCIEYTLGRAIAEDKLTPYYYYPVVIHLSDDELLEYRSLTKQVFKNCSFDKKGKIKVNEYGKMLLIKRARIVAAAQEKIAKLQELIMPHRMDKHILVYCGAATIRDHGYTEGVADDFEMRQIDAVSDLLGNKVNMKISQFTSAEDAAKRILLKSEFSDGKHIQALVAIRCLDEGVNIPSIKIAFILASSTNPKEYIQRRGRVLRKFPGKQYAIIYDFITLPRPLDVVSITDKEDLKMDLSLVKREMTRIRDFSSIAKNPAESDRLILEIEDAYELSKIGGEKYAF